MAEMNKIQSFKTFSELKTQEKQQQLQEEAEAKRSELATQIAQTLAEMEVSSLADLTEDQRKEFIGKLFNEDSAEEIEDKIEDMGEPKPADEEAGDDLEAEMSEGNAFIYAAAKAKAEGKEEFEFNGKSYKVTLKADTGLKESYNLLITEGTRSQVGKIDKNGNITSVYVHWDGYPENMLPKVKKYDAKGVGELIKLGKSGISSLEAEIGKKHDFNDPKRGWTIFYGRDRGENNDMVSKGNVKNVKKYLKDVANEAGAEYVYLYDERDGQWYMADTYDDNELKLSEGLITEGTRWQFGLIDKAGNIQSTYVHYDGYPSNVVPMLKNYSSKEVKTVVVDSAMGGMSSLDPNPKKNEYYNDSKESTISKGNVKNIKKYLKDVGNEAGAEYVYLYDERDGQWYGADVYTDRELKPVENLSESVVTEGKDDFMARYQGTNINLKKGYKHHSEDELEKLYTKLGELVKDDLKVKDITVVFESVVTEARAVKRFDKKLINHRTQPHQAEGLKMIYRGATGNVDKEVSEKWLELKGLRKLPEDWRGQHLGQFYELKRNLYLWATDMISTRTGRPARDSSGMRYFNVMAIFTMDGDEILTLWERPSNLPVAVHGGPGVGFQYESVVTEAKVKSDAEFKEYAFTVLKKAFGEDFDEAKAQEVVDGLTSKYSGDYGAMVGALQSSLD